MNYRVAVIGAGGISRDHLEALTQMPSLEAVAIADIDPAKAQDAASKYGIVPYTDYTQMVELERPDIVIITLPHYLHKEAALHCVRQGCHILLEKPMALTTDECDEILGEVRDAGVTLMVGHTQHYLPENIKAKEIIDQGTLGELVMVHDIRHLYYYRDSRPDWFLWKSKAGGGILMNLGGHSIDKIQWMTDSRTKTVKATLTHHGPRGDVEGSGLIFMEMERADGQTFGATIAQSGYAGVAHNETEFRFTGGSLKVAQGVGLWVSQDGVYQEVDIAGADHPFVLQFRDLVHSIGHGTQPECSGSYAKSVIAALEAVYRSGESGTEQKVSV